MKALSITIPLGNVRLRLAVGDENKNGTVDVSLTVRIIGLFELPPVVIDLDAKLAQEALDAFHAFGAALAGRKP